MNRDTISRKHSIDSLFSKVIYISEIELQSQWAIYLCILVSGFIELSIQNILKDYARTKSSDKIQKFVESKLNRQSNLNMKKIIELVSSFDPDWASDLKSKTDGELKETVDSVIANKNLVAHGKSANLTLSEMETYYKNVLKTLEIIEKTCV